MEDRLVGPSESHTEKPQGPAIPLLGTHTHRIESRDSKRYLHTHLHSSVTHNSQKMETTQMSMDKQMWDRRIMEYYSSLKRQEIQTRATTWMNPADMLGKISPILKDKYGLIPLT